MALADKVFLGVFVAILAIFGVFILAMKKSQDDRISRVSIGGVSIEVEVADSPEERARGLSNRNSLSVGSGMLFIFPSDDEWSFWMKDTRMPLDILWADKDGTIVTIAKNVRPESYPTVFTPSSPSRYVLEVNAGFADKYDLVEGMQLVVE